LLLLRDHGIEAADRIGFQPCHRAAAVEDEYQLGDVIVCFHDEPSF